MANSELMDNLIKHLQDEPVKVVAEETIMVDMSAYRNYHHYKNKVCDQVMELYGDDNIVVRKSYDVRQRGTYIGTGSFSGVKNIKASLREDVFKAIEQVFCTMENADDKREFIIHRQYNNMHVCGVVHTRDVLYGRPYYMVVYNYMGDFDKEADNNMSRTKWIATNVSREFLDEYFLALVLALKNIEEANHGVTEMDVEFGIDEDCNVRIYQIKPMDGLDGKYILTTDREFMDTKSFAKCNYLDTHHMMSHEAYWNPAQTVGQDPRPLDYSLYKGMLTSGIWGEGISKLGYEPVNDDGMMHRIGNRPYVSIDNLMVGLTPSNLRLELKYKLYNYYEARLRENKNLHKHVDTEVVLSSYNFSTKARLKDLVNYGFTEAETDELRTALHNMTVNMIRTYPDIYEKDYENLRKVIDKRREIRGSHPMEETNVMKLYKYINDLVDVIKNYGAEGYTTQERCDFIAHEMCRSLVKEGYFTKDEMESFTESIDTIESEFNLDLDAYNSGILSWKEFDSRYGHLRLGNCDIRSHSYRELYSDMTVIRECVADTKNLDVIELDKEVLEKAILTSDFRVSREELVFFIRKAIQNNSRYKFEYTKTLSLFLDIISKMGELMGIDTEDMSYLELHDLTSYHSRDSYIQIIEARRNMYHAYSYLVLPDMVFNVGDIDVIDIDQVEPDFITDKTVRAEILYYDDIHDRELDGKIVLLTKSNSGFDWLFTRDIKGIITKYGNKNSNIARKCKDYGIPAVIGCGEKLFQRIVMMNQVELDCGSKKIISVE